MFYPRYSLIVVVLLGAFGFFSLSADAQHTCQQAKSSFKEILQIKSASNSADNEDITYLSALWNIDPAIRQISGSVQYSFTVSSANYDSFRLDLSDSLEVVNVFRQGASVEFIHQLDQITIALPGMTTGDTATVQIIYQGVPSNSGFGSFVTSITNAGDPVMWTLSQPFGASDWWPAKESFSDKIDSSDYFISIPPGYKAAGVGKLVEVDSSSSVAHIYHWKHRYPIATYLIAVAVTNYAEIRREVPLRDGNLELLNYCYPAQVGEWDWQQTEVIAMLQYFDSLFTPYPFMLEKYGHAQFGWGGGMEHQTMSFMADLGPWLTSHELGHQWFGDAVTCASWKDIWLNEGFATYITGLFFERFNPPAFYYWRKNVRDEITSQPGGSVIVDDTTSVNRIFDGRLSYAKGAFVLHMLRNSLGDDVFYKGLRSYLEDPQLKHRFAQTSDFQAVMEAESGVDLDTFFTQWIYGEGYPNIEVKWMPTDEGLYVQLSQSPSIGNTIFSTQVPMRLFGASDSTTILLPLDQAEVHFLLKPGFSVESIEVDPESDWLARYNLTFLTTEAPLEDQIGVYPNPVSSDFYVKFPKGQLPQSVSMIQADGKEIQAKVSVDKYLGIYKLSLVQQAAPGTYYVQLHYLNRVLSIPVVVAN
jgi:aminopeptidase N